MTATNEKTLTKQIIVALKKRYGAKLWILKTHGNGYQRAGVPDLLLCLDGFFIGIEVKHLKPGESHNHMIGRVSPLQHRELDDIRGAGGLSFVTWSAEHTLGTLQSEMPWME